MGIESYHIPPGLQPECQTLPGLQWESGSPPDSTGNTRGRVKYSLEPLLLAEVDSTSSSPDFEQWFHAQLLNTDQSYTIV